MTTGQNNSLREKSSFILCLALINVALLTVGHALSSTMLVLGSVAIFLTVVYIFPREYFLPLMIFYYPWAALLRTDPDSSSFHSIALLIVFVPFVIKWLKDDGDLKKSYIAVSIFFITYTLVIKFYNQMSINPQYIFFIVMILFFPIYLERYAKKIPFDTTLVFMAFGNLSACISAMIFIENPGVARFMVMNEEFGIGLRVSAYYDDPNFFAAQMLVAVTGFLIVITKAKNKRTILGAVILIALLMYYAMQAVSKAFLISAALVLVLWILNLLLDRRSILSKFYIVMILSVVVLIIVQSNIFSEQIEYYLFRFGNARDAVSLTTGRWELWQIYIEYILENPGKLVFGIGASEEWWLWTLLDTNNVHMTPIQLIYQLGLIGVAILFLWWKSIYHSFMEKSKIKLTDMGNMLIMAAAIFVPWFALDMLYFREFFYFPILLLLLKGFLWEKSLEAGELSYEQIEVSGKSEKIETEYGS